MGKKTKLPKEIKITNVNININPGKKKKSNSTPPSAPANTVTHEETES